MNENRSRSAPEGTGLTRAGRAQLPLLDRLIDADPSEPSDRPLSSAAAMDALRASICSDLEELLNTRRRWSDPHQAELERSLVGFGLPDASGAFNDPRRREELPAHRGLHPPPNRIVSLKALVEATDKVSGRFLRVDALLRADPPEPIAFDDRHIRPRTTVLRNASGGRRPCCLLNRELEALRAGGRVRGAPSENRRPPRLTKIPSTTRVGRLLEGAFLARACSTGSMTSSELDGLSVLYPLIFAHAIGGHHPVCGRPRLGPAHLPMASRSSRTGRRRDVPVSHRLSPTLWPVRSTPSAAAARRRRPAAVRPLARSAVPIRHDVHQLGLDRPRRRANGAGAARAVAGPYDLGRLPIRRMPSR
jgi:type VI secretion system protein ImpF